ncbi:MAG: SPFH domain-containing protein [Ruminococcus sp.]|nr:SPFH domain-containing protein [Ruminococcus sp.]MBQ7009180.1 SPFH domain-containing protein [Ruminococcus sp.]
MGVIKALLGSAGGVMADQWKEYFMCEALSTDVLVAKGKKKVTGRSSNTKGDENVITNGSVFSVAIGQCAIVLDQGLVTAICADPGEYTYDTSSEPSIFCDSLGKGIIDTFKNIGRRFTFGGVAAKDQRIYYINTKEILNNPYGTQNPVPFRLVDNNIGLDVDITVRCNGAYSYRIADPLLFFSTYSGNVANELRRDDIAAQLKTELLTALQPAFFDISQKGIRYNQLPGCTMELTDALRKALADKWLQKKGIELIEITVNSATIPKEDEDMIKQLQKTAVMRNAGMAAATLTEAQAQAMKDAANNKNGAMMGFMGMNMAQQAGGIDAQSLFNMNAQQQAQQQAQAMAQQQAAANLNAWTCSCGTSNTGKFCTECAKPKPAPAGQWTCSCGATNTGKFCTECAKPKPNADGWTCSCGAVNTGKFCTECAKPRPAGAPIYKCDKCGWTPEDPKNPPKFCPECGDSFDENDIQK